MPSAHNEGRQPAVQTDLGLHNPHVCLLFLFCMFFLLFFVLFIGASFMSLKSRRT